MTPREIVEQRAAGQVDTTAMVRLLTSRGYTPERRDPTGGDGYIRGEWGQIEDALLAGLLSEDEYEQIARAAPSATVERSDQRRG